MQFARRRLSVRPFAAAGWILANANGETVIAERDHPFGVPNDDHEPPQANYRCAGLADMAAAINDGRPHRCSLELATHVVEVMTGILRAGEERAWVDMTTTCDRPEALSPEAAAALLA